MSILKSLWKWSREPSKETSHIAHDNSHAFFSGILLKTFIVPFAIKLAYSSAWKVASLVFFLSMGVLKELSFEYYFWSHSAGVLRSLSIESSLR